MDGYVKLFCSKDCPDACSFSARFDGKKLDIKPDGFLGKSFVCSKLKGFFNREVKYNKSESRLFFRPAPVEDVIKEAAGLIRSGKRILYYRGSGNLGYSMFAWDVVASAFDNVYFVDGSPCDETGIEAHIEDFGVCTNPDIENLEKADTILVFGRNAFAASPHFYSYLLKLSKDKKVFYIDPVRSETSRIATRFIRINPASDGALAYCLIDSLGYDRLSNTDEAFRCTGISVSDFELLRDSFIQGRVAIVEGYGLQRYRNGKNNIQWLNRLAYLSGNLNMLYYSRSSKEGFIKPTIEPKNRIPISEIVKYLKDGFFDGFFVVAANPIMSLPDNHIWEREFRDKPLISVDTNLTQTSSLAEYFIRVGGMFSSPDAQGSYFFNKTHFRDRLVEGLSDYGAALMLAKQLGVGLDLNPSSAYKGLKSSRRVDFKDIQLKKPYYEDGKIRLMSLSHMDYLNSQTDEKPIDQVYLNRGLAEGLSLGEGSLVLLRNGSKEAEFRVSLTDKTEGDVAFVYKSACKKTNYIFSTIPTDTKNGIAYNDTFVQIRGL
ncbi:molybdopterin-dependent oxidoreductase [Hippea sp. KM1]|uniref:molybdopterin-dependent oxidoreductase n=1 Tax=Hippea sp. KM1 TaxID=944481 RepID=UPI00046D2133|nr:molybdopterin-dependent oxidoreductase [Hippea sp. KM1]